MPRESRLIKFIKNFVHEKTAEPVDVHLREKIIIKHTEPRGSTILAIFWANVLLYPGNYPPLRYKYRKHRDESGVERLVTWAEGIVFVLNLTTGTLTLSGQLVYEWFTTKFIYVLDRYDEAFKERWQFKETPQIDFPPLEDDTIIDIYTETEEYLLMKTTVHREDSALQRRIQEHCEELISGIGDLSIDEDLLVGFDLQNELTRLSLPTLRDSFKEIYHLWKSLLSKWFSIPETKVYIVTPSLDADRLADIVKFFMRYRVNGYLDAMYVTHQCDVDKNVIQLQKDVGKTYSPREQTFIEYHIYRKMMCPMQAFGCSFIAGVHDGVAEVLTTSSPFHGRHFVTSHLDTVSYLRISEDELRERLIKPISSPVTATQY